MGQHELVHGERPAAVPQFLLSLGYRSDGIDYDDRAYQSQYEWIFPADIQRAQYAILAQSYRISRLSISRKQFLFVFGRVGISVCARGSRASCSRPDADGLLWRPSPNYKQNEHDDWSRALSATKSRPFACNGFNNASAVSQRKCRVGIRGVS